MPISAGVLSDCANTDSHWQQDFPASTVTGIDRYTPMDGPLVGGGRLEAEEVFPTTPSFAVDDMSLMREHVLKVKSAIAGQRAL